MLQIKLVAALLMPAAFLCSVASAQEQEPGSRAKSAVSSPPKPPTQTSSPVKTQPQEAYGSYVPYVAPAPKTGPQQNNVADITATSNDASNAKTSRGSSSQQTSLPPKTQPRKGISAPDSAPIQSTGPAESTTSSDLLPDACVTPIYVVPQNDVFGSYVPYVAPPKPTACITSNSQAASASSTPPNSSIVQKPQTDGLQKSAPTSSFKMAQPTSDGFTLAAANPTPSPSPTPEPVPAAEGEGYVREVPLRRAPTIPQDVRPFHSIAIGFKASTLGAGIELTTPVAGRINLRSSFNFMSFVDPFNIDGVDYGAKLHLKSSQTTLDWFITRQFHISPGIIYMENTMSAPASVGPGQTFVLGTQTFLNSVDDPMAGTSSAVYPHKFVPLLLFGFGNPIPREYGGHISFPIEFGAAFTGAPVLDVALNGTACTPEGCVNFGQNAEAQTFLKQEIHNLNQDLKSFPIYPILSVGVAYRF